MLLFIVVKLLPSIIVKLKKNICGVDRESVINLLDMNFRGKSCRHRSSVTGVAHAETMMYYLERLKVRMRKI